MNIDITNVSKSYKNVKALNDICLKIVPGIHGLLGPNGAGKTTLMRILATILAADQGKISWGKELTWSKPEQLKGEIGYLPQQFGMYKQLKVQEALANVALLKNIPHNESRKQIHLAIDRTNLSQVADRKVEQLSGGMLRRLGVAQAILGEPRLLILDEPSVGLDPAERINLRKLIREYDNGERIILLSSHIVGDIESMCSAVTVMNKGQVIKTGTLVEIQSVAANHVIEDDMGEPEFRELEEGHSIINFAVTGKGYRVRYLANGNDEKGRRVYPTLEDSYTYIIREG